MAPSILIWAQLTSGAPLPNAEDEINALQDLHGKDGITVTVRREEPWSALRSTIDEVKPSIFHFIGHGKRGHLDTNDVDDDGFPGPTRITPPQVAEAVNFPGSSVTGLFLNGCDTAHWAPHLIPADGWFIGATRPMNDDEASFFASRFYPKLAAGESEASAFESTLGDMEQLGHSGSGRMVRWVADPTPTDFLHKIFSRPALTYATVDEGSLQDLAAALDGVRKALTTKRLITREDLGNARTVYCRERFDDELIGHVKSRLSAVTTDLRQLRKEFPRVVQWANDGHLYTDEDRQRFLTLADRLDTSRNVLLAAANEHLPGHQQLQPIPMSSQVRGGV